VHERGEDRAHSRSEITDALGRGADLIVDPVGGKALEGSVASVASAAEESFLPHGTDGG